MQLENNYQQILFLYYAMRNSSSFLHIFIIIIMQICDMYFLFLDSSLFESVNLTYLIFHLPTYGLIYIK